MDTTGDKPVKKGGRPLGSMNRLAREAREKAAETGKLPHEILLDIARGEPQTRKLIHPITGKVLIENMEPCSMEMRLDAAKAAAPYYAPKISTVEVIQGVGDEDLNSIIARAAAEAGVSLGFDGEGEEGEGEEGEGGGNRPRRRIRI